MQARIYRFEIVRALANAVFEAKDTSNGSTVTLYEWTPAIADREAAKDRLDEIREELHAEVFSVDASLYLIATSTEQATASLATLNAHYLFTGNWSTEAPRPKVVEPPIVPPTIESKAARSIWPAVFAAALCSAVALGVGLSMGKGSQSELEAAHNQADSARSQAAQTNEQLQDANQHLADAQAQNQLFSGFHILKVTNPCSENILVAARFLSFNQNWTTEGWLSIEPQKTKIVAVSANPEFYLYARDSRGHWGNDSGTIEMTISEGDFAYVDGETISGPKVESVRPLQYRVDSSSSVYIFNCETT